IIVRACLQTELINSSGAMFYMSKAEHEKKIFTNKWTVSSSRRWQKIRRRPRYSAAKPHFQHAEDNAFHRVIFVINWRHDARDRVAGDLSHQRNDRTGSGSIEQL